MIRRGLFAILIAGALALAGGYAGALHPLGDSLAVFRAQIAVLTGLVAGILVWLGWRRIVPVGVLALGALGSVLWAGLVSSAAGVPDIVLYQKNLSFRLSDPAPLIADIRQAAPDVLTLQEVTPANEAVLRALAAELPTQLTCRFARVGGVAIATRWALVPGSETCRAGEGMTALQVVTPDGPLWLVSLHLHWPYPYPQAAQLLALLPALRALDGPVLIGGDFNMVPWSHTLRAVAQATGGHRIGKVRYSFPRYAPFLPLPIDHVLAPQAASGTTDLRPLLGSDHRGVLARLQR